MQMSRARFTRTLRRYRRLAALALKSLHNLQRKCNKLAEEILLPSSTDRTYKEWKLNYILIGITLNSYIKIQTKTKFLLETARNN